MEKSITQVVEKVIVEISKAFVKGVKEGSIDSICVATQIECETLGKYIISEYVKQLDMALRTSKRRKEKFSIERLDFSKMLLTNLGDIELKRTLYVDKKSNEYKSLVDRVFGLENKQRISNGMKARFVEEAAKTSYNKAANKQVSRQTVCNIVKGLKDIETDYPVLPESKQTKIEKLYIEADEDHIHLNNGKNAMVKLVYVYEGKDKVYEDRRSLRNVKVFTQLGSETEELWNKVQEYVYSTYNTTETKVYLQGDGAAWIKVGRDYFIGSEFVLDSFHVYKSIKSATGHCGSLRSKIIRAIEKQDSTALLELYREAYMKAEKETDKKEVKVSYKYLRDNFTSIHLKDGEYSCCAEGHVSHILSKRLSRNPMGWSITGAKNIAALRAYLYNDGDILTLINRQKDKRKIEPEMNIAVKKYAKMKSTVNKVGYALEHNIPILSYGLTCGTAAYLNNYVNENSFTQNLFS